MSRWFRLDDDVINDPKILLLPEQMRWIWVAFLCVASKNSGRLPDIQIIALSLRVKPSKAAEYLTYLTKAGLIDEDETGFAPHNWAKRQFKSDVTDPTAPSRQKAYRDRNRERNASVTVARPHTHTQTDTQTEKKESSRAVALDDDWPEDFGEQFWQAYPRKTEKLAAMKKLATVRKSGLVPFAELLAAAKRYAATNPDPKYTKHPTTWLNAGCWADETHPGAINGNGNHSSPRRSSSADFLAGMSSLAADIVGDSAPPRTADPEIPLGRVNIDG